MALTLWHNPRCSKSRQALKLLEEAGVQPKLRLYLKEPPSADELKDLLKKLDIAPADLIRSGERVYKDLALAGAAEAALLSAMVENPILIQRPIAEDGDRAIVGRPPEDVLKLVTP